MAEKSIDLSNKMSLIIATQNSSAERMLALTKFFRESKEAGEDLNFRDRQGSAPLHNIILLSKIVLEIPHKVELVGALKELGADFNARITEFKAGPIGSSLIGYTPLRLLTFNPTVSSNDEEMTLTLSLLECGAKVDAQSAAEIKNILVKRNRKNNALLGKLVERNLIYDNEIGGLVMSESSKQELMRYVRAFPHVNHAVEDMRRK